MNSSHLFVGPLVDTALASMRVRVWGLHSLPIRPYAFWDTLLRSIGGFAPLTNSTETPSELACMAYQPRRSKRHSKFYCAD